MKKCSAVDVFAVFALLALLIPAAATAGLEITGRYQSKRTAPDLTPASLRKEIEARSGTSFEALLARWEVRYGARATLPLLELAAGRGPAGQGAADPTRYTALMGAARLGGPAVAPKLVPLLKDKVWMIRSGTLRALTALKEAAAGPQILAMLHDPALVVRLEAVYAIRALQPAGAAPALLKAIEDPANYHGGKAQWIPALALDALDDLSALEETSALARLKSVLARVSRKQDPDFHRKLSTVIASR